MNTVDHYQIIDRKTKEVVGIAFTLTGAIRSVNQRDKKFGAIRFAKRAVFVTGEVGVAF